MFSGSFDCPHKIMLVTTTRAQRVRVASGSALLEQRRIQAEMWQLLPDGYRVSSVLAAGEILRPCIIVKEIPVDQKKFPSDRSLLTLCISKVGAFPVLVAQEEFRVP